MENVEPTPVSVPIPLPLLATALRWRQVAGSAYAAGWLYVALQAVGVPAGMALIFAGALLAL